MVFQDALAALNPVRPVGRQIAEGFPIRGLASRAEAKAKRVDLMARVGIPDAGVQARARPHQFLGGMRQRAMIAMAIALRPALIIADEPTIALDVTVQARILDFLRTIRDESGPAIMLIGHDLGVIAEAADRAVVMYAGRVAEDADVALVFDAPRHPYTRGLLASRPRIGDGKAALEPIPGTPPDPARPPGGCVFRPRCPLAIERCRSEIPALREVGPGRAACHRAEELPA